MCGVIALYSQKNVAQALYTGMRQLQHRGQDAAGIATQGKTLFVHHGLGKVEDVFSQEKLHELRGTIGIGHTRYPTSGGTKIADAQPFYTSNQLVIALAHSGHIHNAETISKNNLPLAHTQSTVDSNILLQFLSQLLENGPATQDEEGFFSLLCAAANHIFQQVQGSYSVVSLIVGKGLLVFRDPQGIRPLVMGERVDHLGNKEYLFASESTPFKNLGFELQGDVPPGTLIYVSTSGQLYKKSIRTMPIKPCSFEYVYFAHPESIINGIKVTQTRKRMGTVLAKHWQNKYPHIIPDWVVPIPSTANIAAQSFAHALNLPYIEAIEVNHLLGRSFIMTDKNLRKHIIEHKLSIKHRLISGKTILLFDDSIVRGTTVLNVVSRLRALGVKKIYLVTACPPIVNTCTYGINIPTRQELIAADKNKDQIQKLLGVDALLYPSTDDLMQTVSPQTGQLTATACLRCMNPPA